MPVKVLIVDDSGFFRHRIEEMLRDDPRLQVVGTAVNGKEAVEQVKRLKPDVVTMDVEMPQMNGIEAVRIIMREAPTNVLMLSSLTHEGARVTLQALEAGAADYLPKDIRAWMDKNSGVRSQLIDRLVALGRTRRFRQSSAFERSYPGREQKGTTMVFRPDETPPVRPSRTSPAPATRSSTTMSSADMRRSPSAPAQPSASGDSATTLASRVKFPDCKLVVIGASTGGPAALQKVLTQLPANYPYPVLLVQHMPKTFTQVFAERLNQQCQIRVKEAEDGDRLVPGQALLAPGGLQMMLDPRQKDRVRILVGDERMTYKPSVDVTYASAAKTFGNKVLGVILTGMGSDGCDGARLLKQAGSAMWAQNRESCTIYGMPQAVVNAGLADAILELDDIGPLLAQRGSR
ncbi:protein-glutamate methylesterase/protein-glutamine glutaminase [Marinobacterium sediminicola]|uniref:Protein-glutamate methylesterase/protein-glutamine glutaminase n=1 Tax=Marinobacterium sediminicola TaxID=518898 RepID=A0ABY1RYR3_9GAMM|nr:chemotaxis response regulator protein-glutamate methylesterase [Marinobacterium sediminicola]ULG68751.1 chemotaxis response regulator protein-glutamate methylesterase [Marinobacterium sediminicola]SMR73280.1 two-component system, chemotaxis family, response regulator CheB [Marinobacterium sediminicola]